MIIQYPNTPGKGHGDVTIDTAIVDSNSENLDLGATFEAHIKPDVVSFNEAVDIQSPQPEIIAAGNDHIAAEIQVFFAPGPSDPGTFDNEAVIPGQKLDPLVPSQSKDVVIQNAIQTPVSENVEHTIVSEQPIRSSDGKPEIPVLVSPVPGDIPDNARLIIKPPEDGASNVQQATEKLSNLLAKYSNDPTAAPVKQADPVPAGAAQSLAESDKKPETLLTSTAPIQTLTDGKPDEIFPVPDKVLTKSPVAKIIELPVPETMPNEPNLRDNKLRETPVPNPDVPGVQKSVKDHAPAGQHAPEKSPVSAAVEPAKIHPVVFGAEIRPAFSAKTESINPETQVTVRETSKVTIPVAPLAPEIPVKNRPVLELGGKEIRGAFAGADSRQPEPSKRELPQFESRSQTTPVPLQPQSQPALPAKLNSGPDPVLILQETGLLQPDPEFVVSESTLRQTQQPVEAYQALAQRMDHSPRVVQMIADAARALQDRPVELTLSPEELGKVRLVLQTSESSMSVHVTVERPETLELLRRNIDLLANELRNLGFQNISFEFTGRDGGESSNESNLSEGSADGSGGSTANDEDIPGSPMRINLGSGAGIDIRL